MRQAARDALESDVVAWLCPPYGLPRDMPRHVCRSLAFLGEWGAELVPEVRAELFPPFAARLGGTRVMAGRVDDARVVSERRHAIVHGLVSRVLPVWLRAAGRDEALASWLGSYPWPFPPYGDPMLIPDCGGIVGDLSIERLSGWEAAWRLYRGPFLGTACRAGMWMALCVGDLDSDTMALARANAAAQRELLRVACDAVAS